MATRRTRATDSSVDAHAQEAVRLSREFLRHLYGHDFDWCLNKLAKDFVWIGAQKDDGATSLDEFTQYLEENGSRFIRSSITDEELIVTCSSEQTCSVACRCLVLSPPDDNMIYAQGIRCTLEWYRSGRKLLLKHLHLSVPVDYREVLESYPIAAGTETYRYMRSLVKLGLSRKSVSLYGVDGTVHWVHPSQIIYLEASRKRTIVHCITKDIVVPAVIRDTVDMVGNKIIRVHRSYAVNRDHVVELKAGILLLDDGTSIAIPAKRVADVRAELMGH